MKKKDALLGMIYVGDFVISEEGVTQTHRMEWCETDITKVVGNNF